MWVSVIGGVGTCKEAIVDHMVEMEKFTPYKIEEVEHSDPFWRQYQFLINRAHLQKEMQGVSHEHDVVSVSSVWDTHEVFSSYLLKTSQISSIEYERLDSLYSLLVELKPPRVFIYLRNTTLFSHVRNSLTGKPEYSDEHIELIKYYYDKFVKFVKTPVIEIDVHQPMDKIISELQYGFHSVKATSVRESIWDRKIF